MEKLTVKQRIFADEFLRTGNKRKAVEKAYNITGKGGTGSVNTLDAIGQETSNKPAVKAYMEHRVEKAKEMVFRLSQGARNEGVRLNASRDIIDRAEGKAKEKHEHEVSLTNYVITEGNEEDKPMESTQESVEINQG